RRRHETGTAYQGSADRSVYVGWPARGDGRRQLGASLVNIQQSVRDLDVRPALRKLFNRFLQHLRLVPGRPRREKRFLPYDQLVRHVVTNGRSRINFHAVGVKSTEKTEGVRDGQ